MSANGYIFLFYTHYPLILCTPFYTLYNPLILSTTLLYRKNLNPSNNWVYLLLSLLSVGRLNLFREERKWTANLRGGLDGSYLCMSGVNEHPRGELYTLPWSGRSKGIDLGVRYSKSESETNEGRHLPARLGVVPCIVHQNHILLKTGGPGRFLLVYEHGE